MLKQVKFIRFIEERDNALLLMKNYYLIVFNAIDQATTSSNIALIVSSWNGAGLNVLISSKSVNRLRPGCVPTTATFETDNAKRGYLLQLHLVLNRSRQFPLLCCSILGKDSQLHLSELM